jgi:hypothetical protein
MKLVKFVLVAFLFSLLTGGSCNKPTPVTPPTPVVDAGPPPLPDIDAGVDTCIKFCSHMTDVKCAPDPKCLGTCKRVLQENLIRLPVDCVLDSTSKSAVIKCGATCK